MGIESVNSCPSFTDERVRKVFDALQKAKLDSGTTSPELFGYYLKASFQLSDDQQLADLLGGLYFNCSQSSDPNLKTLGEVIKAGNHAVRATKPTPQATGATERAPYERVFWFGTKNRIFNSAARKEVYLCTEPLKTVGSRISVVGPYKEGTQTVPGVLGPYDLILRGQVLEGGKRVLLDGPAIAFWPQKPNSFLADQCRKGVLPVTEDDERSIDATLLEGMSTYTFGDIQYETLELSQDINRAADQLIVFFGIKSKSRSSMRSLLAQLQQKGVILKKASRVSDDQDVTITYIEDHGGQSSEFKTPIIPPIETHLIEFLEELITRE